MNEKNVKKIDWMITLVPLILIVGLCVVFMILPEQSNVILSQIRFFFGDTLGVYYLIIGLGMLIFSIWIACSKYGNVVLGKPDEMRYDVIPSVIYTDPEVASVGYSKEGAEKAGMHVKEVKLPMSYAGRYLAETNGGKGFIKLVVDTDRNRLVGCHMVGSYASEIIMTATMMVDTEMNPERLKKLVFPHPTVAEIIREAIFHI